MHPDIDLLRSMDQQFIQPESTRNYGKWMGFQRHVNEAGKTLLIALPEPSPERTTAFRKLQEALFWGNLAEQRYNPEQYPVYEPKKLEPNEPNEPKPERKAE